MKVGASYAVAFSPDGGRLAVVSRTVSVFDLRAQRRLFRTKPVTDPSEATFSPDGRSLLIKNTSGRIVLVSPDDGSIIRTLDEGAGEGCAPRFSSCGRYVVDGSWDGDLRVLEVASGAVLWERKFPGEMIEAVHCLESRQLWLVIHAPKATTEDKPPAPPFLTLWKHAVPDGKPSGSLHPGLPFIADSAPSPDGRSLAVVYDAPPNKLTIVDLETGTALPAIRVRSGGCGMSLAWSCQGVIASVQKERVEFYDAATLERQLGVALEYASDVAWSPDGQDLALGSWRAGFVSRYTEVLRDSHA